MTSLYCASAAAHPIVYFFGCLSLQPKTRWVVIAKSATPVSLSEMDGFLIEVFLVRLPNDTFRISDGLVECCSGQTHASSVSELDRNALFFTFVPVGL